MSTLADNEGDTALIMASADGHEGIVELLLQVEGIRLDLANKAGETALGSALKNGHEAIVERLLNF